MKKSPTQFNLKVKKGDAVAILSGKDKGKTGKILTVHRSQGRIVVEGVNLLTRYEKPRPNKPGQKIRFPAPIPAAKAILICPKCGQATRAGFNFLENGSKQRICVKCKTAI